MSNCLCVLISWSLSTVRQYAGEDIEFTKKLSDVEVKEGNSVDLSIEVPTEDANIVWHKDGQALDRDDAAFEFKREAGGRKHSLVIKNATVHHEGEYVVSVGEQECDTTVALHFNVACRMHRYINILYK